MRDVIDTVRSELAANADPARRESTRRFFKEAIETYGVESAKVRRIAKRGLSALKGCSKEEVFALCEPLWQSGYIEEGGVACEWAHAMRKHYAPEDIETFGRWVDAYVHNWASCDTLCNHSVGSLVTLYPELAACLREWALSENRWKRRAAAVSLIVPARKGMFLEDAFAIAGTLHVDSDDMVQKGYGWLLKVVGEAHPQDVFAYLMERKATMPRTAFRYALEKLPHALRAEAMKK